VLTIPYSPNVGEGVFSDVRITPVQPLGHPRLRSVALAEEFDTLEPKVLAALERVKEESKVRRVDYPMKSEHGSRGVKSPG
jgi:hypothetical protein